MANPEHLAILKEGIRTWNERREAHPAIRPDLSNAALSQKDLADANLRFARLTGCDLSEARLCRADLCGADLSKANLARANLDHADLSNANLCEADLSGANCSVTSFAETRLVRTNLKQAHLPCAIFSNTEMTRADLTGADLHATIFANLDLITTIGLDTMRHYGPSSLGLDTIFLSGGRIPKAFLRGCGVPDIFIEYAASLVGKPLDFYSCFISYSTKDQEFAERLHADLQSKGVRCWFAPDDLKIGDKFRVTIDETIRVYDKLLLVLSGHSVHSEWVEKEVETALEKDREQKRTMLFPIRLDDAVMEIKTGWPADIRRTRYIGDFTNWKDHDAYQKALARLLRDLKASGQTGT